MARKRPAAYVPLSAHYADDEAIMEAGEDAELMYLRMLAYAARTPLSEGWVSRGVCLTRLGIALRPEVGPESSPESRLEKLREVGLIEVRNGGFQIVSWLRWNRSAEEMGRERDSDRKRKTAPIRHAPDTGPESSPEKGPENDQTPPSFQRADTEADTEADSATRRETPQTLIAEWIQHCGKRPPERVVGQVAKEVGQMLSEGIPYAEVRQGLASWQGKGLHPSTLASEVHAARTPRARPTNRRQSETDATFDQALAWAATQDRKAIAG